MNPWVLLLLIALITAPYGAFKYVHDKLTRIVSEFFDF